MHICTQVHAGEVGLFNWAKVRAKMCEFAELYVNKWKHITHTNTHIGTDIDTYKDTEIQRHKHTHARKYSHIRTSIYVYKHALYCIRTKKKMYNVSTCVSCTCYLCKCTYIYVYTRTQIYYT